MISQLRRKYAIYRRQIYAGCLLAYVLFYLLPISSSIKKCSVSLKQYNAGIINLQPEKSKEKQNISAIRLLNMENNIEIAYNVKIISNVSHTTLNQIHFEPIEGRGANNQSLHSVGLSINASGRLQDVVGFIDKLKKHYNGLELCSLNITGNDVYGGSIGAELRVRYYYHE